MTGRNRRHLSLGLIMLAGRSAREGLALVPAWARRDQQVTRSRQPAVP